MIWHFHNIEFSHPETCLFLYHNFLLYPRVHVGLKHFFVNFILGAQCKYKCDLSLTCIFPCLCIYFLSTSSLSFLYSIHLLNSLKSFLECGACKIKIFWSSLVAQWVKDLAIVTTVALVIKVVWVWSLAQELSHATGAAKKYFKNVTISIFC